MIGPIKLNNELFVPNATYCCEYCQSIFDFLDMTKCTNCKGNYCLDCRHSSTHKCSALEKNFVLDERLDKKKKKKCNFKGCKVELDLVNNMICNKCNLKYCMDHRLYESHKCEKYKSNSDDFNKIKNKFTQQNKLLALLKKEFIK